MKRSFVALAVFGMLSGAASAQSSVTIFGILDLGARAVKNGDGKYLKSEFDGGLNPSRLGFRGVEDLGDGLKAGFWLELPIFADTGAAGTPQGAPAAGGATIAAKFFQRRSTVSLSSTKFGEVRLGRDLDPSFLNLGDFDIYGTTGFSGNGNLVGGGSLAAGGILGSAVGTIARADNSIAYYLPADLGGVYGSAMVAAGEGTNTSNGNNRYVGARLGWSGGPFNVAAAIGRTRVPGNDDFKVWNAGGSYSHSFGTLMAYYHRATYQPTGLAERSQRLYGIGAKVPFGQSEVRATYGRSDMSGGGPAAIGFRDQDDASMYAIGYIYNLSKRTALHADIGQIRNRGFSTFAFPGGITAGSNFGVLADRRSTAAEFGLRHIF